MDKKQLLPVILACFDRGVKSITDLCKIVGISTTTYYNWCDESQGFKEKCEKAQIEYKYKRLDELKALGMEEKKWQAIAWELERAYPNEFGKVETSNVNLSASDDINTFMRALYGSKPTDKTTDKAGS